MAISDILTRIESDAASEAAVVTGAAESEAAAIIARAETTVNADRAAALKTAERRAAEEAATMLATARLSARDATLAGKRAIAERVIERAREALEALPEGEYLELIAAAVAKVAAGGEMLSVAAADTRLNKLAARLKEMGVNVTLSADPAPLDRGVLLTGDRTKTEISAAAMVADRRAELLFVASQALFGEKE